MNCSFNVLNRSFQNSNSTSNLSQPLIKDSPIKNNISNSKFNMDNLSLNLSNNDQLVTNY